MLKYQYFGELDYLRFEQLMIAYRLCKALFHLEEMQKLKDEAIKIADILLSYDSPIVMELSE